MKSLNSNIYVFIFFLLAFGCKNEDHYDIITETEAIPGDINEKEIESLPINIYALCAFYSSMGGTMCDGDICELTTALGLGIQGSNAHKELINRYFPNDKAAQSMIAQDCYLRPSGASSFSDYQYLNIDTKGDTAQVNYSLMLYNRGEITTIHGPDIYVFKKGQFHTLQRNIRSYIDERY